MGCCGCNNQSSAVTAGIFGLLQGIVWLILDGFFLSLFTSHDGHFKEVDEKLFLLYATRDVTFIIIICLFIAAILHSIWILSSMILLIGNSTKNACCCRQWVIVTSFIIISDIILPIVIIASTISSFFRVVQSIGATTIQNNNQQDFESDVETRMINTAGAIGLNLYKYYIILLITFSKGGIVTIIINICLNVFTNRRASEINNPTGYVIMANPVCIVQGHPVHYPVQQQQFPSSPPEGFANPQYAGNIPLQPATHFATAQLPTHLPTQTELPEYYDRFEEPGKPLFEK